MEKESPAKDKGAPRINFPMSPTITGSQRAGATAPTPSRAAAGHNNSSAANSTFFANEDDGDQAQLLEIIEQQKASLAALHAKKRRLEAAQAEVYEHEHERECVVWQRVKALKIHLSLKMFLGYFDFTQSLTLLITPNATFMQFAKIDKVLSSVLNKSNADPSAEGAGKKKRASLFFFSLSLSHPCSPFVHL